MRGAVSFGRKKTASRKREREQPRRPGSVTTAICLRFVRNARVTRYTEKSAVVFSIGVFTALATLTMAEHAKSSSVLNLWLKIITKKQKE
jgi:hypothetical protein